MIVRHFSMSPYIGRTNYDIFEKNIIQSEYIVITDADLLCAPQWLEQSKTLFNTYQDIGSVATQVNFDHEIGKNIKTKSRMNFRISDIRGAMAQVFRESVMVLFYLFNT